MIDFSWWLDVKRTIVEITTLDRDALHIYASIAIQFATAWLFGWRLSQWRCFLPLLSLELANEAADLFYEVWPPEARVAQYWASVHDILNTLAVPILLLLITRWIERRAQP